jgi:hypothetical protein
VGFEVSETAKACSYKQELHKRHFREVEVAHQTEGYCSFLKCRCRGYKLKESIPYPERSVDCWSNCWRYERVLKKRNKDRVAIPTTEVSRGRSRVRMRRLHHEGPNVKPF